MLGEKMTKLETIKRVIKENYKDGNCGIYNTVNIVGDPMINLYNDGEVRVDICYYYSYFEVLGLSIENWNEIVKFYYNLEDTK